MMPKTSYGKEQPTPESITEKTRFHLGDKVFSMAHGYGVVTKNEKEHQEDCYPIEVHFSENQFEYFTEKGEMMGNEVSGYQVLFNHKGDAITYLKLIKLPTTHSLIFNFYNNGTVSQHDDEADAKREEMQLDWKKLVKRHKVEWSILK
jgi:hypothetical protein